MAKSASKYRPPPDDPDTFGLEHEFEDVRLAVYAAENWHVLPYAGGLFDQPASIINDMIRYINKRDEYMHADNDGSLPPAPYQEQVTSVPVRTLGEI